MAAEAKHRDAIVTAAARLFRQRGFSGTGMNDIVAESGAPKGSVYHYFPDGKTAIGVAALLAAGRVTEGHMAALAAQVDSPEAFFRQYAAAAAKAITASDFRNGCPVAAVVLDTPPGDSRIMAAAAEAIDCWRQVMEQVCGRAGMTPEQAEFVASVAISAVEGALMQSRALRSTAPLEAAGEAMAMLTATMRRASGSDDDRADLQRASV